MFTILKTDWFDSLSKKSDFLPHLLNYAKTPFNFHKKYS